MNSDIETVRANTLVVSTSNDTHVPGGEKRRLFSELGPGLITGAADDDPSGIATYSQGGAQFGYAMLWTVLFTYP